MFHKCFDFVLGYFEFFQVSNWLFMYSSSNANCDGNEGLTSQPVVVSVWMSGLYFVVFAMWALFGNLS